MIERCPTGIEGLDKALNGGIPRNNIVLISGGAGTGKSTLCLQFLVNGVKIFNEKSLYISTEQSKKEIFKTAESFGWDLASLEATNKLKVVYFDIVETDGFLEKMYELYTSFMPKRVVIDSLTTLADSLLISNKEADKSYSLVKIAESVSPIPKTERLVQKSLLYHLMKKLRLFDSTILLTSELLEGQNGLSADQISEFVCDGVVVLKYLAIGETLSRTIEIKKMRYTTIEGGIKSYEFGEQGIKIWFVLRGLIYGH